ncbi:MAG: tol-pal system protein YbgF [Deltaproteobacteria bacterium]|nr:tol-pal system protein YbgF [Deltaproteobacteria bacterium]
MKTIATVSSIALLTCVWVSGCATQADLQAQNRENDQLRTQLADSRTVNDAMRRELEKMRGEMEELRFRVDRASKTRPTTVVANPQVQNLEERIASLERQLSMRRESTVPRPVPTPSTAIPAPTATPPPAEAPQVAAVPPPPTPPPPPPVLSLPLEDEILLAKESPEVQEDYRGAWQALNGQQYDKAIQQFRTFQRKNPTSELADDAQYWIGESYFTRRDYNRAILEYNDVLKYRKGDKVAAALLRQSQAFVEIGDKTDARLILQKLINDHPNSRQAKEAREKLQSLGR